jgi:hypothetical protein
VGVLCFGALVLATALNMTPSILAWQQYGRPAGVAHQVTESEIYGLKIRLLVTPTRDHWFPPFKAWLARDAAAGFPFDNENISARLGVVATVGFLGLMAALIFPMPPDRTTTIAAGATGFARRRCSWSRSCCWRPLADLGASSVSWWRQTFGPTTVLRHGLPSSPWPRSRCGAIASRGVVEPLARGMLESPCC